jgi:ubiquinone/menaquinone biosynthesis C-methylase UbiE
MGVQDFIAGQLRKPTGFFGRHVAGPLMARVNTEINHRTLAALSLQRDDRVLEVGPGPGDLMARLAAVATEGSVTGVDFSPEMVGVCSRRFASLIESGRIELRCANAEALPYPVGRFTKACTVNTIYFWPEPTAVLREIGRVLEPGGRLAVSFFPTATMKKLRSNAIFALCDGDQAAGLLREGGFCDIEIIPGKDWRGQFLCVVGRQPAI